MNDIIFETNRVQEPLISGCGSVFHRLPLEAIGDPLQGSTPMKCISEILIADVLLETDKQLCLKNLQPNLCHPMLVLL